MKTCIKNQCERVVLAKGLCSRCYNKARYSLIAEAKRAYGRRYSREYRDKYITVFKCKRCGVKGRGAPSRIVCHACWGELSRERALARLLTNPWPNCVRTSIEVAMLRALEKQGFKPVSQFGYVGPSGKLRWVVDIAIPAHKVLIECHGSWWHCEPGVFKGKPNGNQLTLMRNDVRKRAYFSKTPWKLFEFWESDIMTDAASCAARVRAFCNSSHYSAV